MAAQGVAGTNEDKVNSSVEVRKNSCGRSVFRGSLDGWIACLFFTAGNKQDGST